jgi:hypothetical protein
MVVPSVAFNEKMIMYGKLERMRKELVITTRHYSRIHLGALRRTTK